MSDLWVQIAAAVEDAPPTRLVAVVRDLLHRGVGATGATLRVAEYRQTVLRSLEDPSGEHDVPVNGTGAGRAFATQRSEVTAGAGSSVTLHLPLSARGDRLGVLDIELPGPVDAGLVTGLERLASLVATELAVALPVTDPFERARRLRPFTLAAELQWSLLPGRSYAEPGLTVAGALEPAYSVAGDAYDWGRDHDLLRVSVCDGTGRGVPASLATGLAVAALRNARRAGVSLPDQAALADQALYAHYGGEQFVSALLLSCDLTTGLVNVIDAGSPALLRLRQGDLETVSLEPQLPLGMFEETAYEEQQLLLEPGDRLLVVSDGLSGARSRRGLEFGEAALNQAVRSTRLLGAAEAARHLMRELALHRSGDPLDDDAVAVVLDWTGTA